jgi:hypothetical protein
MSVHALNVYAVEAVAGAQRHRGVEGKRQLHQEFARNSRQAPTRKSGSVKIVVKITADLLRFERASGVYELG